jgi:hypothetical protein
VTLLDGVKSEDSKVVGLNRWRRMAKTNGCQMKLSRRLRGFSAVSSKNKIKKGSASVAGGTLMFFRLNQ